MNTFIIKLIRSGTGHKEHIVSSGRKTAMVINTRHLCSNTYLTEGFHIHYFILLTN